MRRYKELKSASESGENSNNKEDSGLQEKLAAAEEEATKARIKVEELEMLKTTLLPQLQEELAERDKEIPLLKQELVSKAEELEKLRQGGESDPNKFSKLEEEIKKIKKRRKDRNKKTNNK